MREFDGARQLEILGTLVDTENRQLLLPPKKIVKIISAARRLISHATKHRRFLKWRDVQRFAVLVNSTAPSVLDCRLRLRELFNSLALPAEREELEQSPQRSGEGSNPGENRGSGAKETLEHMRLAVRDFKLSHAAVRDLRWWARIGSNPHVGRAIWHQVDACVYTHASMSGWGSAWNGHVPASGFFK